jgi:hypothetical protein
MSLRSVLIKIEPPESDLKYSILIFYKAIKSFFTSLTEIIQALEMGEQDGEKGELIL